MKAAPGKRQPSPWSRMASGGPGSGPLSALARDVEWPRRPLWLFIALVVLLEFVVPGPDDAGLFLMRDVVDLALVALIGASVARAALLPPGGFTPRHGTDLLFFAASLLALTSAGVRAGGFVVLLRFLVVGLGQLSHRPLGARLLGAILKRPSAALVLSFSGIIFLGTVVLASPAARADHGIETGMAALFTAASATCVTGLSVVDVGSYYSRFGHWVIMALVQLGGLGVITLTSGLAVALRRRLSGRTQGAMQELLEAESVQELRTMLLGVIGVSFAIEFVGALCLYPSLRLDPSGLPLATTDRAFYAVFHAVSAYCNAGFTLYPDNLARLSTSVPLNVTVMALVVVGGLGFAVVRELLAGEWIRHGPRQAWVFLSLHAKLSLLMSAGLVVTGTAWLLALEANHAFSGMGAAGAMLASLFHAVTLRTGGFTTVSAADFADPTRLLCIAWMFVGGSPGGTAGGVKTTTLGVVLLAVRTMMRGRTDVEAFGRSIPTTQVYRAVAVVALAGAAVGFLVLCLVVAEPGVPFLSLLFEATSAFGSVGYSVGVTRQASAAGQLILVALMFIGRTGPFTLALALGRKANPADFSYPAGKVLVG